VVAARSQSERAFRDSGKGNSIFFTSLDEEKDGRRALSKLDFNKGGRCPSGRRSQAREQVSLLVVMHWVISQHLQLKRRRKILSVPAIKTRKDVRGVYYNKPPELVKSSAKPAWK